MTTDSSEVDDTTTAMLERVIQRIFRAGVLLQTSAQADQSCAEQLAVGQLDSALNDISTTVLSWTTEPMPRTEHPPTDEFVTAIAHLTVAAGILSRLVASDATRGDCARWTATNDADNSVNRALVMLLDAPPRPRAGTSP